MRKDVGFKRRLVMRLNGLSSTFKRRSLWRASGLGVKYLVHPMCRELSGICYPLLPDLEVHMMTFLRFYC